MRVLRKARIVEPCHSRIVPQELSNFAGVLDMPLHPERNRLDPLQNEESAKRRQNGAHGPQKDTAAPRNISGRTEMIGIDEAVIGLIRLVEHRKALGVVLP